MAPLNSISQTLNSTEFEERVLIRKRGRTVWRDARTRVISLPLHVYSEEAPLGFASIISLIAYFVLATIVGTIAVIKIKLNTILAVFAFPQGVVATLIGALTHRKVVIQTDGGDVDIFLESPLVRPIILASLRRAAAVTAQSTTKVNRLLSLGINASLCPVIGIDTSRFEYVPTEEKEKGLVLYVGRLSREKCPGILLKACNRLNQSNVGFKLFILGDGPLRNEILESVSEMNLKDLVTVKGYVPHSEIHTFLEKSSIFVLPSMREGRSVALLEAMSSGCLCIVSDIPDNRDLIRDMENGITFRINDEEDLANKLQFASQNFPRMAHLTRNARRQVEDKHSIQAVGKKLEQLLSEL
jgi:glycosyltransferase involved in cell wall biosynthesis